MNREAADWSAGRGGRWVLAGFAACAGVVAALLFSPLRFMKWWAPEWKVPISAVVHVSMWAGVVLVFWPLWRRWGRRRTWRMLAVLSALGAASELIQPLFGRTAEVSDVACDVLGGGAMVLWLTGRRGWSVALFALLCVAPFADTAWLIRAEQNAGALLHVPGARWSEWGWTGNGVEGGRDEEDNLSVSPSRRETAEYPGIFRLVQQRDWSGSGGIRLRVWWPEDSGAGATMGLRVDDRRGNPPYGERYQTEFRVEPGWNTVEIRKGWLETPGGAGLDRGHVMKWGVFLIGAGEWEEWRLGAVELLGAEEGG